MKTFVLKNPRTWCIIIFTMVTCCPAIFAGDGPTRVAISGTGGDSILIYKQAAKRSDRVSLYPDTYQKVIFFSVKGDEGKAYQLFVFDLDGNVVRQAEIRNKQTTLIRNMDKGTYLYQVFSDDDRISSGRICIR